MDLSLALGVPLVMGILMGLWGWPVPWGGEPSGRAWEPGGATEPVGVVERVGETGAAPGLEVGGGEVDPGMEKGGNRGEETVLRDALEAAQAAQLELAGKLASLRAIQEEEVASIRAERDETALKLAELRVELAITKELLASELRRFGEEGRSAEERREELEREMRWLRAERWDDGRWRERMEALGGAREAEKGEELRRYVMEGEAMALEARQTGEEWEALWSLYREAQRRLGELVREGVGKEP